MEQISPFFEVPRPSWEHDGPALSTVWTRAYYDMIPEAEGELLAKAAIQIKQVLFQEMDEMSRRWAPAMGKDFQEFFAIDPDLHPCGYLGVFGRVYFSDSQDKPILLRVAGEGSPTILMALVRALIAHLRLPGDVGRMHLEDIVSRITPEFTLVGYWARQAYFKGTRVLELTWCDGNTPLEAPPRPPSGELTADDFEDIKTSAQDSVVIRGILGSTPGIRTLLASATMRNITCARCHLSASCEYARFLREQWPNDSRLDGF